MADEIGIVIIGRNEGERLRRCLTSIDRNAYRIVYVDSASTDGSQALAARMGAVTVNLDMDKPFTAARARNEGFRLLKASDPTVRLVQFVDGDCELDSKWLLMSAAFLNDHDDVALVCGRRRERSPDSSIYNWLCDLEWNTPCGETSSCGGDFLVRAATFEQIAGFREEIMAGEEPEMCARLRSNGWRIWRLDAEMTCHDAAISRFAQWWRRSIRTGYGYAEISTINSTSPFQKEAKRAVFWGGLVPLLVVVAMLISPYGLLTGVIYPLQVARIAVRRGPAGMHSWIYSFFSLVGKFAEFQGMLRFYLHRLRRQTASPIEYKNQKS
jgi:glycosyltransferase involved in cell wall biosynthesis